MKLFDRNATKNKRIAAGVRGARNLMNTKGAHWMRGKLYSRRLGRDQYCTVGGLNAAFGIPQQEGSGTTYDRKGAVPKRLSDRDFAVFCLAREIEGKDLSYFSTAAADGIVEDWNDDEGRVWEDVSKMLKVVARNIQYGRYTMKHDFGISYSISKRA